MILDDKPSNFCHQKRRAHDPDLEDNLLSQDARVSFNWVIFLENIKKSLSEPSTEMSKTLKNYSKIFRQNFFEL